MASKAMLLYDYELISRTFRQIKESQRTEAKPMKVDYSFMDYVDPILIKKVVSFQKEEDLKQLKTPTNVNSASLKPPHVRIVSNDPQSAISLVNHYEIVTDKNSPHIPLMESHDIQKKQVDLEEIENEVKKRLEVALDGEREAQKVALEKMMEERFNEWEQEHKNREIQENIKNKDAVLNEMYEKINIEEQKFQMLMKIRELDDENSGLKLFLETCPPFYKSNKDGEEVNDQLSEEEGENEEKEQKIKEKQENEEEAKKRREREFFELCAQGQDILTSMATDENEYERELKVNAELW